MLEAFEAWQQNMVLSILLGPQQSMLGSITWIFHSEKTPTQILDVSRLTITNLFRLSCLDLFNVLLWVTRWPRI